MFLKLIMFTFTNVNEQINHILCDFCDSKSNAIYKCIYTNDDIEPIYFCKICYDNC